MNAPDRFLLPDVQSLPDDRDVAIDAAGIRDLRCPVAIRSGETIVHTVGRYSMTVGLPARVKGTHMSRFVEIVERETEPLDAVRFRAMVLRMLDRLEARSGTIALEFPYFIVKRAPVSGVESRLDCDVRWQARIAEDGGLVFRMRVAAAATSLCPCSKEISAYGAHNQRSRITIDAEVDPAVTIEALVAIAERSASCEVYGLLKRPDEKYVTERAYDNPRFVEDVVREAALALDRDARVGRYTVEAENFESIHNHTAYARIASSAEERGR